MTVEMLLFNPADRLIYSVTDSTLDDCLSFYHSWVTEPEYPERVSFLIISLKEVSEEFRRVYFHREEELP